MEMAIRSSVPAELQYLAKIIENAGYKFYIVGGFVRDIFLGSCDAYENDVDVCGDCPPDVFTDLISNNEHIKLCEANYPLGTLKIIVEHLDIEYTCFRMESYRGDGYHTPQKISFTNDILEDAKRRDFTINAMYLNPLTYEILDFFGGQNDIESKIIRTVRQSDEVFTEDALRILRMCRFSAKLGFKIDDETLQGAKNCVCLLKNISVERIGSELDKIIWDTEHIDFGIDAIYSAKINEYICGAVHRQTAEKVTLASKDKYVRWAVFLSDLSPQEAKKFTLYLSLGNKLAKHCFHILSQKNIAKQANDEIILAFAGMGLKMAKRQIEYIKCFSESDSEYLKDIYISMKRNNQFIPFDELAINGNDIADILSVSGKDIKHYKNMAYTYAVLNPNKNNYDDLKSYLITAAG